MSGAGAAMASEALDLASMMAWLGWVPQRTAGVPAMYGMYRRRVFFFDRAIVPPSYGCKTSRVPCPIERRIARAGARAGDPSVVY